MEDLMVEDEEMVRRFTGTPGTAFVWMKFEKLQDISFEIISRSACSFCSVLMISDWFGVGVANRRTLLRAINTVELIAAFMLGRPL